MLPSSCATTTLAPRAHGTAPIRHMPKVTYEELVSNDVELNGDVSTYRRVEESARDSKEHPSVDGEREPKTQCNIQQVRRLHSIPLASCVYRWRRLGPLGTHVRGLSDGASD